MENRLCDPFTAKGGFDYDQKTSKSSKFVRLIYRNERIKIQTFQVGESAIFLHMVWQRSLLAVHILFHINPDRPPIRHKIQFVKQRWFVPRWQRPASNENNKVWKRYYFEGHKTGIDGVSQFQNHAQYLKEKNSTATSCVKRKQESLKEALLWGTQNWHWWCKPVSQSCAVAKREKFHGNVLRQTKTTKFESGTTLRDTKLALMV